MVWWCIGAFGMGSLHIWKGIINAERHFCPTCLTTERLHSEKVLPAVEPLQPKTCPQLPDVHRLLLKEEEMMHCGNRGNHGTHGPVTTF